MIPDIGVMMGAYIFTRMLSFVTGEGPGAENLLVKVFAVLTMIVTVFMVFDLLPKGAEGALKVPQF